jgi:phosphatidate cytidylyltransferase
VLKLRLLSALVMVPLVIILVLFSDQPTFAVLVALGLLAGAWEWSALVPLQGRQARLLYLAATAAVTAVAWMYARSEPFVNGLLWAAMGWWLFVLFWVSRPRLGREVTLLHTSAKALLGIGMLVSTWVALVVLHGRPDQGPHWVLYVMFLVWAADSGAYFAGKAYGQRKLAPQVSPGKTWEGVYGALAASVLFAFGYAWFLDLPSAAFTSFILVCLVTVLFSIVGDLLESLLKRQQGVKDSGSLIPGHGGVLDRADSLLAAAPVFLFGLRWVGI